MASNSSTLIEKVKLYSFLWLKSKQATFSYNYHDWWKHPLLCMGVHLYLIGSNCQISFNPMQIQSTTLASSTLQIRDMVIPEI
ncbi:hypothetical protein MTR_8g027695 [Medicago truncatula]|uniref:Uncharacterized protein n=1 Tax=Medicago truncatula TaxID=3880 RepID=G8A2W9_MEDTR|nr:hypothetical protein MTR_8g027695 [Medicago truncatula]